MRIVSKTPFLFSSVEKPKKDPAVLKSSSPGLRHDLSAEKRDHSVTTQDLSPLEKPSELPLVIPAAVSTPASSPSAATVPIAVTSKPAFTVDRAESSSLREEPVPSVSPQLSDTALPDPPRSLSASPAIPTSAVAAAVVKEMNGVSEKEATSPCSDVDIASQEPVLLLLQTLPPPLTANAESQETHSREAQAASPSPPAHAASTCSAILTSTASAALIAAAAPLPILQLVNQGTVEAGEGRRTPISSESKEVGDVDIQLDETLDSQPPNSRKSPIPGNAGQQIK